MKSFINQELCKKCKLCIEVCPVNIIEIDTEGIVDFIPERESICLECGQCMAICSTNAINIKNYSYKENFDNISDNIIDNKQFTDLLASRRSVRNFKNKAVEKEVINEVLNSLKYAPYGAAPNKVEVTVINNRDTIEKALPYIEKFLDDIIKWVDSPIVSRIIKFKKGIETFNTIKNLLYPISKLENYKLEYGDRITRGAPSLIIFHAENGAEEHSQNAVIYSTYTMLSAHSMGLGATMNGIVPASINKVKEIKQIFKIPENHEAVISIMLGYPKYKYNKAIKREQKKINWID